MLSFGEQILKKPWGVAVNEEDEIAVTLVTIRFIYSRAMELILDLLVEGVLSTVSLTGLPEADPGEGLRGLQPPLWEVFKFVWLPMSIPFSNQKFQSNRSFQKDCSFSSS